MLAREWECLQRLSPQSLFASLRVGGRKGPDLPEKSMRPCLVLCLSWLLPRGGPLDSLASRICVCKSQRSAANRETVVELLFSQVSVGKGQKHPSPSPPLKEIFLHS